MKTFTKHFILGAGLLLGAGSAQAEYIITAPNYQTFIKATDLVILTTNNPIFWTSWATNRSESGLSLTAGAIDLSKRKGAEGEEEIGDDIFPGSWTTDTVGDTDLLTQGVYGYTFERNKPDYYLGEAVLPPEGVNWSATWQRFQERVQSDPAYASHFYVDTSGSVPKIYFVWGGTVSMDWVLLDQRTVTVPYQVAMVANRRPYRVFWTDYPYNAPPINLQGKFVKFFGNPALLTPKVSTVTNHVGGIEQVVTQVTEGLYLDKSTMQLYAKGELSGQVMMAYYDSGNYENLLDAIVIEIASPGVKQLTGIVGQELHPSGDGYATTGLSATPTASSVANEDDHGAYIYQHKGTYAYSPKNGRVFATRPTVGKPWKSEIYWNETDSQNVSWPFERSQYTCKWPAGNIHNIFVRGNMSGDVGAPVMIPQDLTAELYAYQEPAGHARPVESGTFTTIGEGFSLLKITGQDTNSMDNIWWMVLQSVFRGNAQHFDVEAYPRAVGEELTFDVAASKSPLAKIVDTNHSAYLYAPGSGKFYNPSLYKAPALSSSTNKVTPSVLYFVNTATTTNFMMGDVVNEETGEMYSEGPGTDGASSGTRVEAWWYNSVLLPGMPVSISVPACPQVYAAYWKPFNEVPQILLASQLGSAGKSLVSSAATNGCSEIVNVASNLWSVVWPHPVTDGNHAVLYVQNNINATGYNPNEEHAFVMAGGDGSPVTYALRSDLNERNSSRSSQPAALMSYVRPDGRPAMQLYYVQATNRLYPAFAGNMEVGRPVPGPHPLDLLPDPWTPQTRWASPGDASPAFRDRKGVIWTRHDGEMPIEWFYPMQEGFFFPTLTLNAQPATQTPIPWMARYRDANANVLTGLPAAWTWTVKWPTTVPEMPIGQTLTTATAGLPEVWGANSVGLLYPHPTILKNDVARLFDPTVKQTTGFTDSQIPNGVMADFLLTTGPHGKVFNRRGFYYFRNLPPSISTRFYFNPNAPLSSCLQLIGEKENNYGGVSLLYVNVLNDSERTALKGLVKTGDVSTALKTAWDGAMDALATEPVIPRKAAWKVLPKSGVSELVIDYDPVDHFALTTMGGTNYVVLIYNDATNVLTGVTQGDPISMQVFKVVPKLYQGRLVARQDQINLLSEALDIVYNESFAGEPEDYMFEWRSMEPAADGVVETDGSKYTWTKFGEHSNPTGQGITRFTVGLQGATLQDLVNTFWIMRYKPTTNAVAYTTVGDVWSDWMYPTLAEGWVQRVLNNITPFTQRMTDLYENRVETSVSMLQQIGAPFEGDIALNQDNMTSIGLIQLYETVLNRAESLSLLSGEGINNAAANKQLLLAVERLADLYTVLGNEAFDDAQNPTISFGQTFVRADGGPGGGLDYGALSSSLFCFDNQLESLLDEELALLRGRTLSGAPPNIFSPYFNRLIWNYTKGITAGEVAYAVNYNISGFQTSTIDAGDAALLYPQGHGDAWGHYLSALKGWYRLLRNPHFSWTASQTEMLVNDSVVNVDYFDEAAFADTAEKLTSTATEIMNRTARKVWKEGGESGGGYNDADPNRAFGYGEWGVRGGLSAFYNWAVANSLLPSENSIQTNGTPFKDLGLRRIVREGTDPLRSMSLVANNLQQSIDRLDAGLNPLGLSDNAIPFDITPVGMEDGRTSHYEQIAERARLAMQNADVLLERAQLRGNHLRQLQNFRASETEFLDSLDAAYEDQLLAIFGYPYDGDIGAGGTYAQGYKGPDVYHYFWMEDMAGLGVSGSDLDDAYTLTFKDVKRLGTVELKDAGNVTLSYTYNNAGFLKKPTNVTGTRRAMGRIQMAYMDYIRAYVAFSREQECYEWYKGRYDKEMQLIKANLSLNIISLELKQAVDILSSVIAMKDTATQTRIAVAEFNYRVNEKLGLADDDAIPALQIAGTAVSVSPAAITALALLPVKAGDILTYEAMQLSTKLSDASFSAAFNTAKEAMNLALTASELDSMIMSAYHSVMDKAGEISDAIYKTQAAYANLIQAAENCSVQVAAGIELLEKRELSRQQAVNRLTQGRYSDMLLRMARNEALSGYSTAYDFAQRYVYLAAKAYDYDSCGGLSADRPAGDAFLREIIATRSLGQLKAGLPAVGGTHGDAGLSDILARMNANWLVLKPRLGINNTLSEATWFSLRKELFGIKPGEEGAQNWRAELAKYWVDDLQTHPDFRRYCENFAATQGLKPKEPGFVIPFSSSIDFGYNLFGKELTAPFYGSDYHATKIAAAGVRFRDYNTLPAGSALHSGLLSSTPRVYLVPTGIDRMRSAMPGKPVQNFQVVDQVIPIPYAIGANLDEIDWAKLLNGYIADGDVMAPIRKHKSFRAVTAAANATLNDLTFSSSWLIGRSVWNTQWLLFIPAGYLNQDPNRDATLDTFIKGMDYNRNGKLDQLPVSDIEIGFRTYSY